MSLIEVMISTLLLSIAVVAVDATVTVLQAQQVKVNNRTQALEYLQQAQEAITKDVHAATSTWTAPALPTSAPSTPITATSLTFTASLGGGTPTINVTLNTTTHVLLVTCTGVGCRTGATASSVVAQADINNVDPSSGFTLTTNEVSTTTRGATTNTFYFTNVSSSLILDAPSVGATHEVQTQLADPDIVANNAIFSCQVALSSTGGTGSC
jgi:hypothetical protein